MNTSFKASFLLELNNPKGLSVFLEENDYLNDGERLERLEKAGEGNMNVVLRAITDQRSFILKQSRPWVNKYPSVKAPAERIVTEHHFYQTVVKNDIIKNYVPEIYCFDKDNLIMCMEDFGAANDFISIYKRDQQIGRKDMADIAKVVSELHYAFRDVPKDAEFTNMDMRLLNHEHIFVLPLQEENGFNLNNVLDGLQTATEKFRNDEKLKRIGKELGECYLADNGTRLLHGDYYPGSWLSTEKGFKMIDPEFCFIGPPEFELGVAVAHLKMAQQSDSLVKDLFIYYHFDSRFDGSLLSKFAGMEIIRRLIGLAQLPLELDLKERLTLLDEAYELVVNG